MIRQVMCLIMMLAMMQIPVLGSEIHSVPLTKEFPAEIVEQAISNANANLGHESSDEMMAGSWGDYKVWGKIQDDNFIIYEDVLDDLTDKELKSSTQSFFSEVLRVADEENMEVSVFLGQFQGIDDRLDRILASSMFSGVKANLYSGYRAFKPFVDVINTILGVVAVALVVLLIASTLVDLIFLSCPEKIMNFRDSSGVIQYRGRHSKEVPVPPFISTEAIEAFYRSQIVLSQTSRGVAYNANINSTKSSRIEGHSVVDENIYLSYFLMRAPSYILLAICIAFLISGGLSGLIGFVLRLTSGFSF